MPELTASNTTLIVALQAERRARGATNWRHLATRSVEDWEMAVSDHISVSIPGEDLDAQKARYALQIASAVEARYPTEVMAEELARSDVDAELVGFLRGAESFDILLSSVDEHVGSMIDPPNPSTVAEAKRAQRLRRTSKSGREATAMYNAGYGSAWEVAAGDFDARVGPAIGVAEARQIQQDAGFRVEVAQALLLQIWETTGAGISTALGAGISPDDLPAEWQTLFGAADCCACEHCASVLSPAAYLVDLLEFLDARGALPRLWRSSRQVRRRPDIEHIALSCANSQTEMPYLELVNEILEDAVAPKDPPARQTTWSAVELATRPEHLDPAVYAPLGSAEAVYPWRLPFDLWTELTRVYLGELGVSRAELLERYGQADVAAAERLGLTPAQWALVAGTASTSAAEVWGVAIPAVALATVASLLRQTRLSFEELEAVGGTRFVGGLAIAGRESCDTSKMHVTNLGERLDSLHRFVRLRGRSAGRRPCSTTRSPRPAGR